MVWRERPPTPMCLMLVTNAVSLINTLNSIIGVDLETKDQSSNDNTLVKFILRNHHRFSIQR